MATQIVKLIGQGLNNTVITGGLVPKGAYSAGTDYAVGDSVDYNGSSYVMHTNAAAGTVPTDTAYWQILAAKGDTGATGATGDTGAGVAAGGTANQALTKINSTDYNTQWSTVDKTFVGLGNVDNTSDANKPISTATQTALDGKVDQDTIVYDVKDYGAMGDGSTDDTAAIQSALTAGAGAEVFLSEGTYIVDPDVSLAVPANTTFRGPGILKIKANSDVLDNLVKVENADNVTISGITIDGNRANQDASDLVAVHYGVYVASSDNCRIENVTVYGTTGVGIHIYDSVGTVVSGCDSSDNRYHGFELEQTTSCSLTASRGHHNLRHGVFLSPGEVGGTGSIGNIIANNNFDHNGQYGFAAGIDAAGGSIGLSRDNVVSNNSMKSNAHYGVSVYRVDDLTITSNIIEGNGYIGLYLYRSERNQVIANRFRRNSQSSNGAYDEILIEGANDGQASQHNLISNNFIYIDGSNKANWAIREATTGDGPNVVEGNYIPDSGVAGRALIQHVNSRYSLISDIPKDNTESLRTFDDGLAIAGNATLPGGTMGLDAPFGTAALRFYNGNSGGNLQFVSPNGSSDWYAGGNAVLSATSTFNNSVSFLPKADSTYTLGTSSLYWSNTYTDRLYVNSTAYIDGGTAGQIEISGNLLFGGNITRTGDTNTTLQTSSDQWNFVTGASTRFTINNGGVQVNNGVLTVPTSTPASASATGTTGTITWDSSYIYICTATNTWKRVAIATW